MVGSHGSNVRNWTTSRGITFSQAPTWTKGQSTFETDLYGYRKGTYMCDAKLWARKDITINNSRAEMATADRFTVGYYQVKLMHRI